MNTLFELSAAELTTRHENAMKRIDEICERLNRNNQPDSETFACLSLDESFGLREEKGMWLEYVEQLETALGSKAPS